MGRDPFPERSIREKDVHNKKRWQLHLLNTSKKTRSRSVKDFYEDARLDREMIWRFEHDLSWKRCRMDGKLLRGKVDFDVLMAGLSHIRRLDDVRLVSSRMFHWERWNHGIINFFESLDFSTEPMEMILDAEWLRILTPLDDQA